MASYPGSIYEPRTRENRSGVEYDPTKKTIWFKEDADAIENEIIALETFLRIPTSQPGSPVAGSAWFDTAAFTLWVYTGTEWKFVVLG